MWEDKEFARRISERIESYGLRVWHYEWQLVVGDSSFDRIERGISSSDYLIVLLSPNSAKSKRFRQEITICLTNELAAVNVTIIPVLVLMCL